MVAKVLLLNPPSKHGVAVVRDTLYGCWCRGRANYMWPPTSLAVIGAILKKAGLEVSLIDAMGLRYLSEQTKEKILEQKPDYVIINTATISFSSDADIIKLIKESLPNLKVIFMGTHVTAFPKQTLGEPVIDYIILGEPDYVVRDLILALENKQDISKIRGVGFRKPSEEIVVTGSADPIKDLDALPFADRSLIPKADYFNPLAKQLPYATIFSSRGCPHQCIFCTSVILYGNKFRPRSAENVLAEIEELVKGGYKEIFFRDETFTIDRERVKDICQRIIARGYNITWMANARVDTVDEETVRIMKKAGCHLLKFGVESGSQKILNNLKKGTTIEKIEEAFRICKKVGMGTVAHMMLGSPGETKETIEQTIKFVKKLEPDYASFNITTPYPGTKLWDLVRDKLNITDDFSVYDIEKTLEKSNFNDLFCELSTEELDGYYNRAYAEFYFNPKYIIRRLARERSLGDLRRRSIAGMHLLLFAIKNRFTPAKKEKQ